MEYNLFPKEYENKVYDAMHGVIVSEHKKHYEKQRRYKERLISSNIGSKVGLITGIVGGGIVCCMISFATGLVVMFIFGVLGFVVNIILAARGEYLIKEDEENYQKWREKFEKTEELKIHNYRVAFENDALKLSLVFGDNPMTKEIVNKMKNYVERVFHNADRSSYVEQVAVNLSYRVYKYKVEWVYGDDVENYGFTVNRCNDLKNPIEQAALARAISRMLQYFIKQKYSDYVGEINSLIEVKISEVPNYKSEKCEYSMVEINYKVPNVYYKKARLW